MKNILLHVETNWVKEMSHFHSSRHGWHVCVHVCSRARALMCHSPPTRTMQKKKVKHQCFGAFLFKHSWFYGNPYFFIRVPSQEVVFSSSF